MFFVFTEHLGRSTEKPRNESCVLSSRDSSRLLINYIPSIVSEKIVHRISVMVIYEHSSTDGTCVSPLVRACIKSAH